MKIAQRQSSLEFTLFVLRDEIRAGAWGERVPGVREVAARLKVSKNTVTAAYARLEEARWLAKGCVGRKYVPGDAWPRAAKGTAPVMILLNGRFDDDSAAVRSTLLKLKDSIERGGRACEILPKSQYEMNYEPARVLRYMRRFPGAVWVVVGGAQPVLSAIVAAGLRAIAFGGDYLGVDIPGVGHDGSPAMREIMGRLIRAGHRRIVFVAPQACLPPTASNSVRAFIDELAKHGIEAGPYHLPVWNEDSDAFVALLNELFRYTPPTALILMSSYQVCATLAFLSARRIRMPEECALALLDSDSVFVGMQPALAQVELDWDGFRRAVLRWIRAEAPVCGAAGQVYAATRLLPGGTLGEAPKVRLPGL